MATQQDIEAVVSKGRELGLSDSDMQSVLKSKGFFSSSINPTYTQADTNQIKENSLPGVGLIRAQSLGQKLGGYLYRVTQADSALGSAIQGGQDMTQRVLEQINKNKSIGKDTSRLEAVLKDLQYSNAQSQQTSQDLRGGGVTGMQAFGSAIQTVAAGLPFGRLLGTAATAAKGTAVGSKLAAPVLGSIERAVARPIIGAGIEGAAGTAAMNLGSSIEQGKSAQDTAISTALGAGLGFVGGAALGGAGVLAGKALAPKVARTAETVAGDVLTKSDKLLGNDANLKSAVLNRELFGTGGDITTAPRVTAFADLAENLKGRKVISLDNNRAAKVLTGIKGTTIGDGYQVVEQRMAELYKEIDKGLKASNGVFDRQPIIDFINTKANDKTVSRQVLNRLGFKIDKTGGLSLQPRGLVSRIIDSNNVSDIEKIITEELAPELQAMARNGLNAPSKSTLAGLRQVLNETIDKHITSLGGEYSALKQKYGAYRGIEDSFKELATGGNPQLSDMIDTYGISNIIAGRPVKGSLITGLNLSKRFFNSDNHLFRSILESASEFKKVPSAVSELGGDIGASMAKATPDVPSTGGVASEVGKAADVTNAPAVQNEIQKMLESLPEEVRGPVQQKLFELQELLGSQKKNLNEGFASLNSILTAAGITSLGALGVAATSGEPIVVEFPQNKVEPKKEVSPAKEFDYKKEVAFRETGIVKGDKYKHRSRNKNGTYDLGKYAANTESLKAYGDNFLGRNVSEKEFLASPDLQEKFFEGYLKHMEAKSVREPRLKDPQFLMALWHRGFSDLTKERLDKLMSEEKTQKYLNNKPS